MTAFDRGVRIVAIFSLACMLAPGASEFSPRVLAAGATPVVSVSPYVLTFGNEGIGVTSSPQTVSLSNTGSASLTITSMAFAGANAGEFTQSNNCGASVAAGASCSIKISFTPSASGAVTAWMEIIDNAGSSPQVLTLSGTGVSATTMSVLPYVLTFGNQAVGSTSSAQTVTLRNTGNANLFITSMAFAGANGGEFSQTNNCGASVAAGASCSIEIAFTPSASGDVTAWMEIIDTAGSSPQVLTLSGTGAAAATMSVSPYNLTFGDLATDTTGSPQTVTLTNTGNTDLIINSMAFSGAKAGDFIQNNTCGTTVAAGASCNIVILFTPAASGSVTAWMQISDNAGTSPQVLTLTGTGTHDVILDWSASSSSGIMGYYVFRGTSPGGEGSTPLNSTPVSGTSYVDQSVSAGATYYYVITAVAENGVTQSAPSNEASATVPTP